MPSASSSGLCCRSARHTLRAWRSGLTGLRPAKVLPAGAAYSRRCARVWRSCSRAIACEGAVRSAPVPHVGDRLKSNRRAPPAPVRLPAPPQPRPAEARCASSRGARVGVAARVARSAALVASLPAAGCAWPPRSECEPLCSPPLGARVIRGSHPLKVGSIGLHACRRSGSLRSARGRRRASHRDGARFACVRRRARARPRPVSLHLRSPSARPTFRPGRAFLRPRPVLRCAAWAAPLPPTACGDCRRPRLAALLSAFANTRRPPGARAPFRAASPGARAGRRRRRPASLRGRP